MTAISTVIATFNAGRFLADAIDSVLAQCSEQHEVIVVDDGSTDDSREVALRFGGNVRCEQRPHAGQAAALNAGIACARGEFLAFIDADDLWEREKLAAQLRRFEEDPSLEAIFTHVRNFYSPELDDDARRRLKAMHEVQPGYFLGTMLIRREALHRVGPFDERRQYGAFISWYTRAIDAGIRTALLDEILLLRRIHAANFSRQNPEHRQDYVQIAAEALARRRKAASSKEEKMPRL